MKIPDEIWKIKIKQNKNNKMYENNVLFSQTISYLILWEVNYIKLEKSTKNQNIILKEINIIKTFIKHFEMWLHTIIRKQEIGRVDRK